MPLSIMLLYFLLSLVAILYRHLTKNRGQLESLGVPMDGPNWLLGSGPFDHHERVVHDTYRQRFRAFGARTYGRYDGIHPCLVTVEPEIVKNVLVKNFANFSEVFFYIDTKKVVRSSTLSAHLNSV